jgi:hypothetical protein
MKVFLQKVKEALDMVRIGVVEDVEICILLA